MREPDARYLNRVDTHQTEVGTLPIDWSAIAMSDLLTTKQLGGNYKNGTAETAWPLIKMGNLGRGRIDCGKVEYVHTSNPPSTRDRLQAGDVLFNTRNTLDLVGKVAIWRNELTEAYFNSNIMRMCFDPERIGSNAYMNYVLNTSRSVSALRAIATGTTSVAAIYSRDFANVFLPLPNSKSEQQSIAETLGDADALIDSLEQLLTKKRQIKQGAMQELLTGRRRLPGFTADWATCELRQLGHVVRGVAYNPDADLADGDTEQAVRLLRSNNVQGGEIIRIGLQFVNRRRVRGDQYLQDGDLLLCMANGSRDLVGKAGRFVRADEHSYTFGAFMSCFRPDPKAVESEFVAFLFQTHAFRQHVDLLLAGSSINNLRPEGVLGFTASIPSEHSEQVAIAQALSDMDAELTALESRLTKARALKQAMAQALLTGRIRLVEKIAS